jgi:hypothetical protein
LRNERPLAEDGLHQIDGDDKPDALRFGENWDADADDLAAAVHEEPTREAGVRET